MRFKRFASSRPALLGALAIALGLVAGSALYATTPVADESNSDLLWKAVAASGRVEVQQQIEEDWVRLQRGDRVAEQTTVRTGKRGHATLVREHNILIVDPDTQVELPPAGTTGKQTRVIQTQGSVLYKVEGKDHPHFEVVTPYLVAGVKGTEFLVTVNERYTSVTVERGHVEVTEADSGRRFDLHDGDAILQEMDGREIELVRFEERDDARDAVREARRMAAMERRGDTDKERDVARAEVGEELLRGRGADNHDRLRESKEDSIPDKFEDGRSDDFADLGEHREDSMEEMDEMNRLDEETQDVETRKSFDEDSMSADDSAGDTTTDPPR